MSDIVADRDLCKLLKLALNAVLVFLIKPVTYFEHISKQLNTIVMNSLSEPHNHNIGSSLC